MANYMKEVAKMLGVEMGENFYISDDSRSIYYLSETGLHCSNIPDWLCIPILNSLLIGYRTIVREPWKPSYRQEYYSIGPGGVLEPGTWLNDFIDVSMYKLGNCYRTVQEAEANKDKWIAFYGSDEMLEV